ncbi:hypothetical protein KQ306_06865 [Synechococcus sp. CS-1324]|uniref:hypothetical protein n=1 Tax=Synechococcus sp. CS-1324 TaxID=2847980 RepID=UPI000DB62415|nr:hypothetical protein [Synechococcus sp. CS-1324]MCT0230568.1 hypothetical protein [Synechococcus sp. CS-1324]PZV05705.1 MAG: hypothetical protein DCF23_02375 [Cyanobium sp.]
MWIVLPLARFLSVAPALLAADAVGQPLDWRLPQQDPATSAALPWRVESAEPGSGSWNVVPASEPVGPGFPESLPAPQPIAAASPPVTRVRGLSRGMTVNGSLYTDTALQVPNGFAADQRFTVSAALTPVNRTRSCGAGSGSTDGCDDAELNIELTPIRGEDASLGLIWNIQSLTSRSGGTSAFSGQSLGFRAAVNLTPTLGVSFGGEQIIQFDDSIDLGRNFYLVLSQAVPLSAGAEPVVAVATVGIGSDFFGYGGNGILGSTNCLSGNNISSNNFPSGTDCFWGPIGSLSLHLGSRVSLGAEWFGYGIGAGISARPFSELPLTLSVYATDFLGNTPSYIEGLCTTNPCGARYYGRMTFSF